MDLRFENKFLIYGGNGWIGKQFCQLLNGIETIHGKSRCDNYNLLKSEIKMNNPSHIICFIGRTSNPECKNINDTNNSTIDWLEKPENLKYNIRDNFYSIILLQKISKEFDIHLTVMGTGCIFDNDNDNTIINNENDKPDFFGSQYSTIKGFTDMYLHICDNVLNIRIRMPINNDFNSNKNFLKKIITYKNINSTLNSVTVLNDMLPIMLNLINKKYIGTYHLINPEPIKHEEILELYKEIVCKKHTYNLINENEISKLLIAKRSKCVLNTEIIQNEYNPPTSRESIIKIFNGWKY